MLSFLTPYLSILKYGGIVAAIGLIVFFVHRYDRGQQLQAILDATQKAAGVQKAQDDISTAEAVKQAQQQQLIQHTFSTIERKVPVYVTKIDRDCHLSVGALRVWNAAIAGADTLSDTSGQSDAAASAFTAADFLNNGISNFAIYHQTATELIDLQDWVKQQEKIK